MKDYRLCWQMVFIIAQEVSFYVQKLFVNGKLFKTSKVYVIPEYSIPFYFCRGENYVE